MKKIIRLEKYKTTGKLKGIEKLKRQFMPVGVSQFKTPKEKPVETETKYKSRYKSRTETKYKSRY